MEHMNSLKIIFNKLKADPFGNLLLGSLAGGLIVIGIIEHVVEYAISQHWIFGVLFILFTGILLVWVSMQTKHFYNTSYPISLVTFYILISVILSAIFFASISYLFCEQEIAIYKATKEINFMVFRNYYFWIFLDLIPVIDVWDVIPLDPQITPVNTISGVPVLLFRIYIIGIVFSGIRTWWKFNNKYRKY